MPNEKRAIRSRLDFSKIPATIKIPNLIEVQKRSYDRFLQMDKLPSERDDAGLQAVFQSVFPITDFRNVSQLGVRGLRDRQLGVQVRPPEGPEPPAHHLP
jgi:DNA-directed RNA polymerase subunit beta